MMGLRLVCSSFLIVTLLTIYETTSAFTTTTTTISYKATTATTTRFRPSSSSSSSSSVIIRLNAATSSSSTAKNGDSSLSSLLLNPLKRLPWNVQKEKERQARRLKQERNILHRQLGIAEDATYEEIVDATNLLIAKAGSDLKQKIKIEVAKDKILQIRLNERLAGLTLSENKEARAQSSYEVEGSDDDDDDKSQAAKEWNAPRWTKGLIVKPDSEHIKGQVRLWGILTAIGLVFPPAQEYLGRFTWLVCVAQLTFRGMPREQQERGGGMGISFGGSSGGGHRKVAFALGFSTWVLGATIVYTLMPAWAKGQRWTASLGFVMQNLIFAFSCSYLQPYKGK